MRKERLKAKLEAARERLNELRAKASRKDSTYGERVKLQREAERVARVIVKLETRLERIDHETITMY